MPDNLFDGGPPLGLQRRLGLIKDGDRRTGRRAVIVALITWFPLLVLTALDDILCGGGSLKYFLRDVGVSARFLVAAPLLVAAESWCLPRLSRIPRRFLDSGIVGPEEQPKLAAAHLDLPWLDVASASLLAIALAHIEAEFMPDCLTSGSLRRPKVSGWRDPWILAAWFRHCGSCGGQDRQQSPNRYSSSKGNGCATQEVLRHRH
jgi:hypothetical protein